MNLFSDDMRRNPWPLYEQMRTTSPLLRVPPPFDAWMVFDYQSVKRIFTDHQTFSSGGPMPRNWFIFYDPPRHTKLRDLISRAFTPRMIAGLETRIRELSTELLDKTERRAEVDLAREYAVPLAMMTIAGMIGIEAAEWSRYSHWNDTILRLSYTRSGGEEAESALRAYYAVTLEMKAYLEDLIAQRHSHPEDDLLTRLVEAEVDGESLSPDEILGFFQLLIIAGQETTSDLIGNAVLCLLENPDQLARLRADPALIPSAVEEVLRFTAPVQWLMRTPHRDVDLHGQIVPAGALLLAVIGSANRDPRQFVNADRFDIARSPNPHLSFGHGIHFCLGAALSRMEAKIALSDLLARFESFERSTNEQWQPRKVLHVYGPGSLPIRFKSRFENERGAAVPA